MSLSTILSTLFKSGGTASKALNAASTLATAYGAIKGAQGASKTTGMQEQAYQQQQAIQQEQLELSKELARRGIATQVDANGNVTAYDQATNTWKTVLSPTQQKIQDLSDQEQINTLQTDAPINRIENIVNATRRSKEGVAAGGVLASLQDRLANPVRGSDLASSLRLSRENAVNKGFDTVSASLGTQALRSGASGGAALAGALAKQRGQAIAQTMGNPDIEGMQLADSTNADRLNSTGNIYNMLASRASGGGDTTFNPTQVGSNLAQTLANARSLSSSASGQQGNLLANAGNTVKTIPDYSGAGDGAASIGTLLSLLAGKSSSTISDKKKTKITVDEG